MKIDENFVNRARKRVYEESYRHIFYPKGISDDDLFFSSIFTGRRALQRRTSPRIPYASLLIVKLKPGGLKWLTKKVKKK
jgi:hypothetical protein